MKRAVGIAAAVAVVGALVAVSLTTREVAVQRPPPDAATPEAAPAKPAPPIVDARVAIAPSPPPPDLGATPPAVIEAERTGLMGRDGSWIPRMLPRGWTATADGWQSPTGTTVRFAQREGRVVGARATFAETSFSSAVSELTVPLVGHHDGGAAMLPGGEDAESFEPETAPREGTLRYPGGEIDWTLWLRTTGEAPFGPRRFDFGDVGPLDGSTGPGP